MPVRTLHLATVVFAAVALSACGGGASMPPAARSTPTPAPTTTPSPNPLASGSTFAYAGSATQTFTLYGTPSPQATTGASPAPTSTPWISTTTANVAQTATIATGAQFGSQSGLDDFATQETDTAARSTTSATTHVYLSLVPNAARTNGADLTVAGTTSADSNGVALSVAYAAPNDVVEQLPDVPNATWTNSAARTATETDPSGESISTTYAADGSYGAHYAYPEGGMAAVQENADLSAVYQAPYLGVGATNSSISIGAPSGGFIAVVYYFESGLGVAGQLDVPLWYPAPTVLASDTFTDAGTATLPSSCPVASAYASESVTKLLRTTVRLDTMFGELDTRSETDYRSPRYGTMCTVVHDDLKSYYDYSGQLRSIITVSSVPLEETVTDETLALSQATAPASAFRRTAEAGNAAPAVVAAIPSLAFLDLSIAHERLARVHTLYRALRSRVTQ